MRKTVAALALSSVAVLVMAACASDSDDSTAPPTFFGSQSGPEGGPEPPPPGTFTSTEPEGCPSTRTQRPFPTGDLTTAQVGALLPGIYRVCSTRVSGFEIRADESVSGRFRWYELDDRFVRLENEPTIAFRGSLTVDACDNRWCDVTWQEDPTQYNQPAGYRKLMMYSDPLVVRLELPDLAGSIEYLRISD